MHDHAQSELDRKEYELKDGYRARKELEALRKEYAKLEKYLDFGLEVSENYDELKGQINMIKELFFGNKKGRI